MNEPIIFSNLTSKGCTNALPADDRDNDGCWVYTWQDYAYASYAACIADDNSDGFCCGAGIKTCAEADSIRANYPA